MKKTTFTCDGPACENVIVAGAGATTMRAAPFEYGDDVDLVQADWRILHFCSELCVAKWAADRFTSSVEARTL